MAGILGEFDEATPLRRTYCSRLTLAEYENEGSSCTEKALEELLQHLESEPNAYRKVVKRRKREEVEEEGVLAYMKAKLWSWLGGEDMSEVSNSEYEQKLGELREGMVKAFDYSEESKGRRSSRRIAERKRRRAEAGTPQRTQENTVPPPPPPPPPVLLPFSPHLRPQLARRPLADRQVVNTLAIRSCDGKHSGPEPYKRLIHQLQGSEPRRRLRKTIERSPGGTPIAGWSRAEVQPDLMPYFNAKLIEKFKSTRSPARSPNPTLASPGTFDSPMK